ncbi:MAG: SsrA-binding protein SmpB [Verrucomicrobiales bacterium]|nr:SsrA-binding protein SmpB [Verrucomicrobiales bacterium]MCP5526024.1 SsrA-binding protein SmpB [Verrucomicrobiales bacterium]
MTDIVTNRRAQRDYHVLETFEAGVVLRGSEVKSLRAGRGQLADAFARVENDEVFLYNAHIEEYEQANRENHVPKSVRKLLLKRAEIRRLAQASEVKGHALVPLRFYWKHNRVKLALAVGQGKQQFDKREDLKRRESDLELRRAMMHRLKRG